MPDFLAPFALVFKYVSFAFFGASNFRTGFLMDSDELRMAEEEAVKPSDGRDTQLESISPPLSNAEMYIKKLNGKVPGFGALVDLLFSPNTIKLMMLVSIGLLIFSPLGWQVGLVGIGLNLGVFSYTVYKEALGLKTAHENQQKYSILKETKAEQDKLDERLAKNPQLKDFLKGTYFGEEKVSARREDAETQPQNKYDSLNAALWGAGMRSPTIAFSLVVSIISLNPISIAMSTVGAILTGSNAARSAQRSAKLASEFNAIMVDMRIGLGLKHIPGHAGTLEYANHLAEMKAANRAIARFEKDRPEIEAALQAAKLDPKEHLGRIFREEYYLKEVRVNFAPKPMDTLDVIGKMAVSGFSWSSTKAAQTPTNTKFRAEFNDKTYDKKAQGGGAKPEIENYIHKEHIKAHMKELELHKNEIRTKAHPHIDAVVEERKKEEEKREEDKGSELVR